MRALEVLAGNACRAAAGSGYFKMWLQQARGLGWEWVWMRDALFRLADLRRDLAAAEAQAAEAEAKKAAAQHREAQAGHAKNSPRHHGSHRSH